MFTLLPLLLLLPFVLGSPVVKILNTPITIPVAVRVHASGPANVLKTDRARALSFLKAPTAKAEGGGAGKPSGGATISIPATNAGVTYTVDVGIGNPATQYTLMIDTGSSNTWVGARTPYVGTSTSVQTSDTFNITYTAGQSCHGTEFTDRVALSPGLVIPSQSIGVASATQGFNDVDGILGLGPVDLTVGTLSPNRSSKIPTVTDNLFSQGTIPANEIAMSFEPTTSPSVTNGELTFGGTDSKKFTGSITFTGITSTSPSNKFWGIDQSIRYGTSTPILRTTAGIVDAGTTLIFIASDAFSAYQQATGGVLDDTTGFLRLTTEQFAKLQSLFFTIGGTTFELTANAQAWPRSLNSFIGGTSDSVYLIVGNLGTPSGRGLDFVNGYAFLERFYSVFDTANHRVGFATTPFTRARTN